MAENPTLGKYEILRPLGEGATAVVYLARDSSLGREVALKVLKPHLASDPEMFKYFLREAQTAAALHHPHIAPIYDMGESGGRFFIAMHRVEGRSLNTILREDGPLAVNTALEMAADVASALDYAHRRGFLHRDVKPANILREQDGDFLLTDFGLARALTVSGLTSTNAAVPGTLAYIAPEVWNQQPLTPAVDQYALACVLYEAIDGQTLFQGELAALVAGHVLHGAALRPSFTGRVTPGFAQALLRALERDPAARYPTCAEFVQALRASLPAPEPQRTATPAPPIEHPAPQESDEQAPPIEHLAPQPTVETAPVLEQPDQQQAPQPEGAYPAAVVVPAAPEEGVELPRQQDQAIPDWLISVNSAPSTAARSSLLPVIAAVAVLLVVLGAWYGYRQWSDARAAAEEDGGDGGEEAEVIELPADEDLAYLTDRDGEIVLYTMHIDGSDKIWRASTHEAVSRPAYRPDGTAIAFTAQPDGISNLYGLELENSDLIPLTTFSDSDALLHSPFFFSDALGFFVYWSDSATTQIKSVDSNGIHELLEYGTYLGDPAFSEAAGQMAIVVGEDDEREIYTCGWDCDPVNRTNNPSADIQPAWSSDGSQIVFSSNRNGSYDLFRMNPDGSEVIQITADDDGDELMPAWSTWGNWIAFVARHGDENSIVLIDRDGSNPRVLLEETANIWWPVWKP